jgi:thiamine-monophosphate kinase
MRVVGDIDEFALIARATRFLGGLSAAGNVLLGGGDDAAVLGLPPDTAAVLTQDALLEGVHFRRDWSAPADVGWKSLAVNVSDLGAMGARPLAATVSLALPPDLPLTWVDRFYAGLDECSRRYGCPVVGGDTVRSPAGIAVSIAALGSVVPGRHLMRGGAARGDLVCVTGVLGQSAAGMACLAAGRGATGVAATPVARHRRPQPPVEAGALLAAAGIASAMMDLSDGLGSDLRRLCEASDVGAQIEMLRLPISDDTRRLAARLGANPMEWALHGGEDFELLFTVPPGRWAEVPPLLASLGVSATIIGRTGGRGVRVLDEAGHGQPLRPRGFAHFAPE